MNETGGDTIVKCIIIPSWSILQIIILVVFTSCLCGELFITHF